MNLTRRGLRWAAFALALGLSTPSLAEGRLPDIGVGQRNALLPVSVIADNRLDQRPTHAEQLLRVASATKQPDATQAEPVEQGDSWLSEITVGVGGHDVGLFSRREEHGADVNLEVRFAPLTGAVWDWLLSPRPHVGVHIATGGGTDQLFAGLTWMFDLPYGLFVGGSLGLAVHDGETDPDKPNRPDRKELGWPVLARESAEFGIRLGEHHALSVMADHISNGGLAKKNEGMETLSVRYTYKL